MFNDYAVTESRIRTVTLENGNVLRMEAKDPYGFISFSLEHGQLPESLKDAVYTSWFQAELAAKKYQDLRKMVVAEAIAQPVEEKKKK